MIQFYDAKVAWYRANIWYDLNSSSYYLRGLDNEIKTAWKFGEKGKWGDFQPTRCVASARSKPRTIDIDHLMQ